MNKPDFGEPWEIAIEELDEDCKTIHIPQIERVLHDSEWAEPEKYQRDLRNAKRIVACVNACAGLTDEELKAVPNLRKMAEACELLVTSVEAGDLPDGIAYRAAKLALRHYAGRTEGGKHGQD